MSPPSSDSVLLARRAVDGRRVFIRTAKWVSAATDLAIGKRAGPRILIYHQVGENTPFEMNIEMEAFEAQIDWLQANGEIVDLKTAVERIGHSDADRTFTLSFDDGHLSIFKTAFPVLLERNVPFTLYLTTHPLEGKHLLHGDERMPLVSWDQVGRMLESDLITVGAHSHEHLDMRFQDEASAARDLEACDRLIEERLGFSPRHFAYPWGHWSKTVDPLVQNRYDTAVIGSGPSITDGSQIHRLSRIPVMASDAHIRLFARKIWGGFRFESGLRRLRDTVFGWPGAAT
jgi:peptidoglycan/xylan/chitin deacetylase (PgdA/CDA1 family)